MFITLLKSVVVIKNQHILHMHNILFEGTIKLFKALPNLL